MGPGAHFELKPSHKTRQAFRNMWAGADVDRAVMPRGELLLLIQQQRRQLKRQKQELEAQQQEVDTLLSELEVAKKRKREEQDEGTEKIAGVAEEGEADEQVEDEEEVEAAEEVPEISAEAACATARSLGISLSNLLELPMAGWEIQVKHLWREATLNHHPDKGGWQGKLLQLQHAHLAVVTWLGQYREIVRRLVALFPNEFALCHCLRCGIGAAHKEDSRWGLASARIHFTSCLVEKNMIPVSGEHGELVWNDSNGSSASPACSWCEPHLCRFEWIILKTTWSLYIFLGPTTYTFHFSAAWTNFHLEMWYSTPQLSNYFVIFSDT